MNEPKPSKRRRRGRRVKNRPLKERELLPRWFEDAVPQIPEVEEGAEPAWACPHFGTCGGCRLQHMDYADQLALKQALFERCVTHFEAEALVADLELTIVPSPAALGYRQRMDYIYSFGKMGLREFGDWRWVVDLEACPLLGEAGFQAMHRCKVLAKEMGLEPYDFLSHKGFLRYVVIRQSSIGQVMVGLTVGADEHHDELDTLAQTLLDEGLAVSVHLLLNESKSDRSAGIEHRHWGQTHIEEQLLDRRFRIGPQTFFQANAGVAELAYGTIRQWLGDQPVGRLLDLYAGTGTITTMVADRCTEVVAVESEAANCELATTIWADNNITNARIFNGDCEAYLAAEEAPADVIIVNPPRIGVRERGVMDLQRLAPRQIIYMSCNPLSLMRDLKLLCESYQLTDLQLLDMFPQTRHFEVLVRLQKRN